MVGAKTKEKGGPPLANVDYDWLIANHRAINKEAGHGKEECTVCRARCPQRNH